MKVAMSRVWEMPSKHTFKMREAAELLSRYINEGEIWVDPFAGFHSPAQITNDLNPGSPAEHHMNAESFVHSEHIPNSIDGVIFDPPYSNEQIARSYKPFGLDVTRKDTQNARMYSVVRKGLAPHVKLGGICISFGWQSAGFGKSLGFELMEIKLIAHGGAHNDTIITVEQKVQASWTCARMGT